MLKLEKSSVVEIFSFPFFPVWDILDFFFKRKKFSMSCLCLCTLFCFNEWALLLPREVHISEEQCDWYSSQGIRFTITSEQNVIKC